VPRKIYTIILAEENSRMTKVFAASFLSYGNMIARFKKKRRQLVGGQEKLWRDR
jgi:hypothetical protein